MYASASSGELSQMRREGDRVSPISVQLQGLGLCVRKERWETLAQPGQSAADEGKGRVGSYPRACSSARAKEEAGYPQAEPSLVQEAGPSRYQGYDPA